VLAAAAPLEAERDQARKADSAQLWLKLAEDSRVPPVDFEKSNEKSTTLKIYREALGHLDPMQLAALSATLPDPEVNAAMVRALRARKRDDEASAECRATLARWSPGDVPRVVEACKDCRAVGYTNPAGPASHSVFAQWLAVEDIAAPYLAGLRHSIADNDLYGRVRPQSFTTAIDPAWKAVSMSRQPIGVVVGDEIVLAALFRIPCLVLAPDTSPRDSTRSATGPRPYVARPGPEARARLLLDAARRNGARRIALVVPEGGGDRPFADALERLAGSDVVRVTYQPGRREHREDAKRVAATGANAVALLGPPEESGDWLPFLGKGMLLGSDELDPAGFHEQARRALEGAILVRTRYTPADTLAWDEHSAAAWAAGWVVGDALAHGADSPKALDRALEARATEADASNRWLALPAGIAKVEVLRVRGGNLEPVP